LKIALDIVDALDKAHRQGVIHRDVKPSNVMLTKSGAKLLDFGLAKLRQEVQPTSLSSLPTRADVTADGTILGTLQYMAPEQLEGKEADGRTDIFAFGAVLYEMLTGKKAFAGKSQASLISAIMSSDPPDISVLQPMTPTALDRIVKTCLAKDPDARWQMAHDLELELQWLREGASQVVVPAGRRRQEKLPWILLTIATLLVISLAIPSFRYLREVPPEMRVEINTPRSGDSLDFALSPDGTRLAFAAIDNGVQRIWVRTLNGIAARPLPGTDDAFFPFWSPDSRSIGFFGNSTASLKRIDVDGGPAQTLATAVPGGRGGTWNRDGTILFGTVAMPLYRVPATGGTPQVLTHFEQGAQSHRFPQFLPDGRHFLFYVRHPSPDRTGIYIGSLDGGEIKFLVASDTGGSWMPSGWLLYMQQGTLRVQPFDIARGVLSGNAVTVAEKVGYDATFIGGFSASAAGMIAHRAGPGAANQLVWFDRAGKMLGTVGDPDETIATPELSPDGHRVAVDRVVQGNQDIWIIDLLRGGATRFTFDAAIDRRPL
jgi:hypothetical protein